MLLVATLALTMDAAEVERAPSFSELPDELLVRMARMLVREDPIDVGRFGSSSRALLQLTHGHAELRAARALVTLQRKGRKSWKKGWRRGCCHRDYPERRRLI